MQLDEKFQIFELDNKYSVAVRASGTEPKIKFYMFGNENARQKSELPEIKNKVSEKLDQLAKYITEDAHRRAEL